MTWQEIDSHLREGARLHFTMFGSMLEWENGKKENVHFGAAKAVMRRDLIVICEKVSSLHYVYRSKYEKNPTNWFTKN